MVQMNTPTVLIIKKELSSYILFLSSMILIQEVFFVYSWKKSNDILVRHKLAKTILLFRHYDFILRTDHAIIGAEKMCSIGVGRKSLVNRPKTRELNFFEKGSYTAKISGFSIL